MTHLTSITPPPSRGDSTPARPRIICAAPSLHRDRCADALRSGGFVVTAITGDGREAIDLAVHYRPDLLLVDATLEDPSALTITETVVRRAPNVHVALLGAVRAPHLEMRAVLAGAHAYVVASWNDAMLRTLRAVAGGEAMTSPAVTGMLIDRVRTVPAAGSGVRPIRSQLTNREWEVLDRLSAGLPPAAVAREMDVANDTVQSHVKRICRKLGVRGYAEAVARADRLIVQAAA